MGSEENMTPNSTEADTKISYLGIKFVEDFENGGIYQRYITIDKECENHYSSNNC